MLRLNKINLNRNFIKTQVKFEEFKVFSVRNTGDYYTCYHNEYISNYKAFIRLINLEEMRRSGENVKEITLNLLDNVVVYWSTNIHMKLLLLVKDISEFLDGLKHEWEIEKGEKSEDKYIQQLKIIAKLECHIQISQDHKATISLGR